MLHFVYRIDETNTGDMNSSPLNYFPVLSEKVYIKHDIYNINYAYIKKHDVVIVGGGGLINCQEEWNVNINRLFKCCENVILWGAGFNAHADSPSISTPVKFSRFKLLSIRDYNHESGLPEVPCPSCLIKELELDYPLKRKIGIIEHKNYPVPQEITGERINNRCTLKEIINFIGSSEIIVTSSYHICYWAALMKKKVILANAFSEKFKRLHYPPTLYSGDLEKDILKAQIYTNALQHCRNLNNAFFNRVLPFIKDMPDKNAECVNLCYITDENYVLPTLVSITSLIKNKKEQTVYNIHILAHDVSPDSLNKLTACGNMFSAVNIILHKDIRLKAKAPIRGYVTPTALLKFDIPEILSDLDKVLYIDGDTLVLEDLEKMYSLDVSEYMAAAAVGVTGMVIYKEHERVGLNIYFNSGVMLLNCKKMREENIPENYGRQNFLAQNYIAWIKMCLMSFLTKTFYRLA